MIVIFGIPASWKISEVVPLPKDGDLELANSNRPVSLLPAMSKICERAALNQFMAYMKSRKRLTEHQSRNKAQHSTETLNVMMTDKFLEAMNNKMLTLMVLLDLSKAFDSTDHAKLLVKLRSLGVSCTALEWFRSYMHDRQQYIRIGSEMSGMCQSTHGVPQGSILGPALFNVYINDMPGVPDYCSLEPYVDDSKLHLSFLVKDIDGAARKITEDLRKVAAWCCQNSLLINPDKTKLLLIGTRQIQNTPTDLDLHVTLLGKELRPVVSARDLGVYMDATLSFDEHITSVTSCLSSRSQINRIKYPLDRNTLLNVINALVFSKLYYCSSVWSSTTKKNINKLQNVQNFPARIITRSQKFDHIAPVLKDLKWLSVESMLTYRDCILVFKCLRGLAPDYLAKKVKKRFEIHNKDTRNKNKMDIPGYRTAAGQITFYYRAVSL